MKSLLDIQKEIRTLEQIVTDVNAELRVINNDIEMLRNVDDNPAIDFKRIKKLAKQCPFAKHPISRCKDAHACRSYLEILLCIVLLDDGEEERLNRLIFIQWLLMEASIEWSLERLYTDCYQLTDDSYIELFEMIPNQYKESLLVDALIVAYINGEANSDIYEYIADLCEAFQMEKDTILFLYQIARMALTQTIECFPCEKKKVDTMVCFVHYFNESIRKKIFEKSRRIVISYSSVFEISRKNTCSFKWKLSSQGQYVQKGDVLAEVEDYYTGKRKKYRTTMDGACFYFQYDNRYYAVISNETDQLEWIRSWMMKRNKK